MQLILRFIAKYKYFLFFLFLESIALFFTIQSHSYHKSKFINSANNITGGFYKKINSINEFFHLKKENQKLADENSHLKNLLSLKPKEIDSLLKNPIDTINYYQKFNYSVAKVIKNSYAKRNNYLTINKGEKHEIYPEMGVVNSLGIIGVTNNVSKNNATVISILNKYSQINVKLKHNNYFGTLYWDGKDYKTVQLLDLERQTPLKVGDTIITGGKSTIFPEGISVGIVKEFEIENNAYKSVNITLFNDMSSLSNVTIINNLQKEEIEKLEALNNE